MIMENGPGSCLPLAPTSKVIEPSSSMYLGQKLHLFYTSKIGQLLVVQRVQGFGNVCKLRQYFAILFSTDIYV